MPVLDAARSNVRTKSNEATVLDHAPSHRKALRIGNIWFLWYKFAYPALALASSIASVALGNTLSVALH